MEDLDHSDRESRGACATTAQGAIETNIDRLIIGESKAMAGLRRLVRCVAPSDASVLLTGPSGSGKEVLARAVHLQSNRAEGPFVAVNCGAIPRELLESELFGHEKGAFTGAHSQRKGRFEEADGGTLFLDEIGDMPADMQVKLLRVLEERAVQRLGGRGQIAVDVRIVAATHRDIEAAIDSGRFREDLFYRLAVFPIEIPPLAERIQDIPSLIEHFLEKAGSGADSPRFTDSARERLAQHGWPGNVRELRNFVERASIMFSGRFVGADEAGALLLRRGRLGAAEREALWKATEHEPEPAVVPRRDVVVPLRSAEPASVEPGQPVALRDMLAEIERRYIEQALSASEGVIADAARMLSLQRTTLIEKLRKYEMKAA